MVKPFKLDHLKKVSLREIELIRGLYEYLPATDAREKLNINIRRALMKHVGGDIRYYISSVVRITAGEFVSRLPDTPIIGLLGLTPLEPKAIFQIDRRIASIAIGRLLGSSEAPDESNRPLTESEQGVLQYLILEILSQIYTVMGREARVHFRFEKFIFEAQDILKYAGSRENICLMTINVSIQNQSGFLHLAFPYPFLEGILQTHSSSAGGAGEKKYFEKQLVRWDFFKVPVWAEAGNSLISPLEMKDLDVGDIVLFDETPLELKGKKIGGGANVHFGEAETYVSASVIDVPRGRLRLRLNEVIKNRIRSLYDGEEKG